MKMKMKTPYQGVVVGLTLAITAPTDAQAEDCIRIVDGLTHHLTEGQLERAKAEAIQNSEAKEAKQPTRGAYKAYGKHVWRLI